MATQRAWRERTASDRGSGANDRTNDQASNESASLSDSLEPRAKRTRRRKDETRITPNEGNDRDNDHARAAADAGDKRHTRASEVRDATLRPERSPHASGDPVLPDPPTPNAKKSHSPPTPAQNGFRQPSEPDDAGDIRWVLEHLHDGDEAVDRAPSASARSLWLSARKSPKAEEVFLTQVYAKVFVTRQGEEQEVLDRRSRVRIEGLIDRCLELSSGLG